MYHVMNSSTRPDTLAQYLLPKRRHLETLEDLKAIIDESIREIQRRPNFHSLAVSNKRLVQPSYPTFIRFSVLRIAQSNCSVDKVVEAASNFHGYGNCKATHNLHFPIRLAINDGRNCPLLWQGSRSVADVPGYPLFYAPIDSKQVKAHPSAALYSFKRSAASANADTPGPARKPGKANTKYAVAEQACVNRSSSTGDNHIALFVKAYLAYFDAIAAALDGTIMRHNADIMQLSTLNIADPRFSSNVIRNLPSSEMVNVCGQPRGYQEFWAYCCLCKPAVFASAHSMAHTNATPFSMYEYIGMEMTCLCDVELKLSPNGPYFYGKPNLIISYIETYAQINGIQSQLNEALQIAMLWPCLLQTDAPVALPAALHAADWITNDIIAPATNISQSDTPYEGLVSSNPSVVLASTLAGAWALQSQLYDFIGVIISDRGCWDVSKAELERASKWLQSVASEPGVGWDLLFRHQFEVTPSFLQLTGLGTDSISWFRLISRFSVKEWRYPAHLRLMQPFWTATSICGQLPWEITWHPDITTSHECITAAPVTIMRLIRLGLLSSDGCLPSIQRKVYPDLSHSGLETITVAETSLLPLELVLSRGIRVIAEYDHGCSANSGTGKVQAWDNIRRKTVWPIGGLQQHLSIRDRLPNAMAAEVLCYDMPGMANPITVKAAQDRLEQVKKNLAKRSYEKMINSSIELSKIGYANYIDNSQPPGPHALVYAPVDAEAVDGAWWCILYLRRFQNGNMESMASLKRAIRAAVNFVTDHPIDIEQMAGACCALDLPVPCIFSSLSCLRYSCIEDQYRKIPYFLQLSSQGWRVVAPSAMTSDSLAQHMCACVDNMPLNAAANQPALTSSSMIPPSNEQMHYAGRYNLSTRVRLLDEMIRRWDKHLSTSDEVIVVHQALFPGVGIPRFLKEDELKGFESVNEPSFTEASASTVFILEFLSRQMGHQYFNKLKDFGEKHGRDEVGGALLWPHRSPQAATKNNISTAGLLLILDPEKSQELLALWFLQRNIGNHAEFVTAVALWLSAINLCSKAWSQLLNTELLLKNEDTWLDHTKQWHDLWRKNGLPCCSCPQCWTQLLYMQSLWGRGGVEVDWEQEISNKSKVPDDIVAFTGQLWSAAYATGLIRAAIREVLETALQRLRVKSFDEFMDNAFEWLVPGTPAGMPSAFNQTELKAFLRKEYGIIPRSTKRSVMETISRDYALQQVLSRPQIVAKLHQKLNETGGKARAIYGVTIWHYIISNWLMAPLEKAIAHPAIDINLPNADFVKLEVLRAQEANRAACFSSYDYPDFNSMHTHYHMSIIYEEAGAVFRASSCYMAMNRDERDLVSQGYKWLQDATFTQVCFLPESDEFIQTVGGLYSGNRDTTLINTVLNIAYARVVDTSCRNMALNPSVQWRLCHGDDIITVHGSYGAAIGWNAVAERANLKGQEKKLLTDRCYHEYLRILGCPDGKIRGSLARVVATFVNGNWETDSSSGANSQVVEVMSAVDVLRRRGMREEFARKLLSQCIQLLAQNVSIKENEAEATRRAILSIPIHLKRGELTKSASNTARQAEANAMPLTIYAENKRRERLDIERRFRSLPANVTDPYMKRLVASLPPALQHQEGMHARLKAALQRSTYGSEFPRRLQIELKQTPQLVALRKRMKEAAEKRGQFEKHVLVTDVGRHMQKHKLFATTMRRIKAFYTVLSSLDNLGGYTKSQLVSFLVGMPESTVTSALLVDGALAADWRRAGRPSAAEVGALENELEVYLSGGANLRIDEEVVVFADNGLWRIVPVRSLMLY
ncbi:uncharacterized protein LMH87_007534 [Akanthomyces muscarius]|uniref:RNA-directed RNA polymerase n=1 Tax=Akanthomyces muscarius TaxID=2231603 RepID=A0A9W8QKI1_AKAMU|nr:uncharacterized protein LMH87_007534 [Akanthomyces muscarius]KAJ4159593.1 hypothetical protein LMH87_007534 [Akanthomyces muscarius]